MKINYVLMYGTPYLKYRAFETFEDISKFLVNKSIVNYSIFKKLKDKEEIEMIYRDNDIHYLEDFVKEQDKKLQQKENTIKEVREYIIQHERMERGSFNGKEWVNQYFELVCDPKELLEILDKVDKENK